MGVRVVRSGMARLWNTWSVSPVDGCAGGVPGNVRPERVLCHRNPCHRNPYVKWYYTQWMRKKYRWRGPLWRERYKSLPIEDETYLAACGLYVECNPVRAGLCEDPAEYPYSSARKYFRGVADDLLDDYNAPVLLPAFQALAQLSAGPVANALFAGSATIGASALSK